MRPAAGLGGGRGPRRGGCGATQVKLASSSDDAQVHAITVQADHRLLAVVTAIAVVVLWLWGQGQRLPARLGLALHGLLAAAALQVALGILTLLLVVPIPLAAAHQAGALGLFTAALIAAHAARRLRPGQL